MAIDEKKTVLGLDLGSRSVKWCLYGGNGYRQFFSKYKILNLAETEGLDIVNDPIEPTPLNFLRNITNAFEYAIGIS